MAKILDGRIVRDKIAEDLKAEISRFHSKCKLVIIQVGDIAESNTYIRQKVLFGEKIGAIVHHKRFDADISQKALIDKLLTMNHEPSIHGIIIQQPIPNHLDKHQLIDSIAPTKDVDGQTSVNIKLLFEGSSHYSSNQRREATDKNTIDSKVSSRSARTITNDGYLPATTKGILTLLDYYKIPIAGKRVVIVGRSTLVGKPTALAFLNRDATVIVCHRGTRNLKLETKNADILVVAVGKPNLITKDHISKGQVVIDVGINIVNYPSSDSEKNKLSYSSSESDEHRTSREVSSAVSSRQARTITNAIVKPESEISSRKLVGDVDFENVSKIVTAITPVPGGIGPMTVASLFQNLLEAHKRQT